MEHRSIFVLALSILLVCSSLGQELHVKHAPPYVVLQHQDADKPIPSSEIPNIISGPLGLHKESKVLKSTSVLKRPKANVLITVITSKEQQLPLASQHKLPVDWDMPFVDMEQVIDRLQNKFFNEDPLTFDLTSADQFFDVQSSSSIFSSFSPSFTHAKDRLLDPDSFLNRLTSAASSKPEHLNSTISSDGKLLAELQMVDDVISTMKKNAGHVTSKTPDLISLTVSGLKAVADEHGVSSKKAEEAKQLVIKHLDLVTDDLKKMYKGNVMVEVLTAPGVEKPYIRKTRSLMEDAEEDTDPSQSKLNLEIDWDQDFPVAFNICLGLVVVLVIAVFLIAYGIGNINPNLESILYRVPQDEHKKIN